MTLSQATQVALLSNASVTLILASPAISRILGHAARRLARLLRPKAGKARPEAPPLDSAGG